MTENYYFILFCPTCGSIYHDGTWTKAKDCKPFLLDLLNNFEAILFLKETCIGCFNKERTQTFPYPT